LVVCLTNYTEENRPPISYIISNYKRLSISGRELASSPEGALQGIQDVVQGVVDDMLTNGEAIPVAMAGRKYSGKFMVRVPPGVHRSLVIQAAEAGVSLNRLIISKLSG
jgi:predicted HicB family RNase H-like nuclease